MTFSKKIIITLFALFAVGAIMGAAGAHALEYANPLLGQGVSTIPGLICLFVKILATKLMPPVVVLMVLWASFLFLTAVGQPGRVMQARATLMWAVIGAAILLMALPLVGLVVSTVGGTAPAACTGTVATSGAFEVLYSLINWFSWSLAILSVAMGLYAGFLYMTSRGDPQKVATAGRVIFYAVVGVLVAIIAFSIIAIVNKFIIP